MSVRVIFTPGHSPGHVMYYFENEGILIGGDLIIMNAVGRTDLPDSNPADLEASIRTVMRLPGDTQLLPGHGGPSTLDQERQANPYVRQALAQSDAVNAAQNATVTGSTLSSSAGVGALGAAGNVVVDSSSVTGAAGGAIAGTNATVTASEITSSGGQGVLAGVGGRASVDGSVVNGQGGGVQAGLEVTITGSTITSVSVALAHIAATSLARAVWVSSLMT